MLPRNCIYVPPVLLKNWKRDKENLLGICLKYASKENEDIEGYIKLERTDWGLTSGAYYSVNYDGINRKLWLCPVTLYVMGEYPEYLYVKKVS